MLPPEYENWAKAAAPYFRDAYGLEGNFALPIARLFVALWGQGLNPRVTSGFRDPSKQKEMQARWDAGNRAGLRARPATNSAHTATGFLGRPAAKAIDIVSSDEKKAADIASRLKVGAGLYFQKSDPGHYYAL
jgi:hypothetical protein